jgi:hypothetical protein
MISYVFFYPQCLFIADISKLSKLIILHTVKICSSMQCFEYIMLQKIFDTEVVDHIVFPSL